MTYPLLEKAPEDHFSPEFLQFLRDNNVVVFENEGWLVIENCKYNMQGDGEHKRWHTAFLKSNEPWVLIQDEHWNRLRGVIIMMGYSTWEMRIKRPHARTVKRLHVHFIE